MMEHVYTPKEAERMATARNSFAGNLLSDRQFNDCIAITGMIERRIQETGSFKDCLGDFVHAFARNERFDASRADNIIRDLFKARTGVTMDQMRKPLQDRTEAMLDRQTNPAELEKQKAYDAAMEVADHVMHGDKITFDRALSNVAAHLATELDVTDLGAKKLMAESFSDREDKTLYAWGKELDETYYRPQIEEAKQQRRQDRSQSNYSRSRQPAEA